MAVRSIGSHQFDIFQGQVQIGGQRVQILPRLGRDYARTRQAGLSSPPGILRTSEYFAVEASAETAVDTTYPGIVGTTDSITDALGQIFENCTVMGMTILSKREVFHDGDTKWRVRAEWVVIAGEQS